MILIFGWGFLGVLYFRVFWNWGIVIILMYYFLTVQSISPYFLPRGITVRIIYVYVYILWVEKFFFPTLYSGQVWISYWQYKVFHHRSMSSCILLIFMLSLRGTKLRCFGIFLSVDVFQTSLLCRDGIGQSTGSSVC